VNSFDLAAAPALLEALEAVDDLSCNFPTCWFGEDGGHDIVKAAIAQARGESHNTQGGQS
jgi:hypothetical protein